MILLYNIAILFALTLGFPLIIPMILMSDKRRKTVLQRLGLTRMPPEFIGRRSGNRGEKPVWVHALSVGEVLSAVPLVKRLKEYCGAENIVFSASTKTGFDIANRRLEDAVRSKFYFPYDLIFSVKFITRRINPEVVIIVETDIWPNFLFEMKNRRAPVVLVNARLSKTSFAGYQRLLSFTRQVFLNFAHVCTQSAADAKRFQALGVPPARITITGNVKFDEASRILGSEDIATLRQSMHIRKDQKVLLAGSTHPGEESMLLDAFSRIKNHVRDLLLVVAPRNPERADSVYRMFNSAEFSVVRMRDLKTIPSGKTLDVIIIDTMGVLKTLYAASDMAFIGGSLVNCGGHNPLEPAAFSKPILFGNDMSDFADISDMLLDAGGALRVKDAEDLYTAVVSLAEDEGKAAKMGANAFNVFNANKGAVDRTIEVIATFL